MMHISLISFIQILSCSIFLMLFIFYEGIIVAKIYFYEGITKRNITFLRILGLFLVFDV